MNGKRENRVEKIVSDLLRGRRLKLRGGDADEKAAITAAARLAGARQGPQRMHPAFRKRLAHDLEQAPREGFVTRRAALVAGLGLAAGAAAGGLGRWIDVGSLSELVEGRGKRVVAGGVRAFLFRRGDTVTAVSSICSHLPCELWWEAGSGQLVCPCHPAKFTPEGHPSDPYHLAPLNKVYVQVTAAGRVEVLGTE
ncbi:MAG: Rieske (2Fe-2S) protein [Chloroflexi bacterium]|nr:MAG: Rieske (2Fe-2S) protein [Chloroflexota bacterium]